MKELRTKQEINQRIAEIQAIWKELNEKAPDSRAAMQDNLTGELTALYWILGYPRQKAIDNASVDLGGDPIDWS